MAESIYFYDPSLAASILFTILYMLPFGYHLYMSVLARYFSGRYNRVGYFVPIMIGAGIEIVAYATRAASVKSPDDVGLYATSSSLIVIAPVLVCASLYILIGRLIGSTGKRPLLFGGRVSSIWIPRIFVTSDILSFLTQASGSGLASSNDWTGSTKDAGIGVLIFGLALQLVTFLLFLVLVIWYDVRVGPTKSSGRDEVRSVLTGIYISGFFITVSKPSTGALERKQSNEITDRQQVRLIYRLIEFSMGIGTYTWNHEWPLYVLEAVPMLLAMITLGWYHPARYLPEGLPKSTELESRETVHN
ncbi:RTA1 domain protein [Talaromyces pinophilus]|uniref:RTA1 domain protein n=1 Tax=Talaromyces pinophilus TaxID=128442 RepID=A0A0B8N5Q4_TALPI|nr:RTA1 domain protein [Talaromyces pinophilus]